jgi:hypothetical protein
MNGKTIKSMCAGIVLGVAAVLGIAAVTEPHVGVKWEYLVLDRGTLLNSKRAGDMSRILEQVINERAGEGWEVAGFSHDPANGPTAILKRVRK